MQDDDKSGAEKPAEPVKTIDHNNATPTAARTDVGSKAV
jgi:sec-independent protein translocase protein TatA